jgi:hypothetical protein
MIGPYTQQLIALAEELSNKMDNTFITPSARPNFNVQFEAQRQFGRQFFDKLRKVYGELMGDLLTLKERNFDPKMYSLANKVKSEVEKIMKRISENNPHKAGWDLVHYVLEKPNRDIIDNLEFLAKHHLGVTHSEVAGKFNILPTTKYAEINSFRHLKELATEIREYMEQFPPMPVPTSTPPPPLERNPMADPLIKAPPDAVTKA